MLDLDPSFRGTKAVSGGGEADRTKLLLALSGSERCRTGPCLGSAVVTPRTDRDHAAGQCSLRVMSEDGTGVPHDQTEAARLFRVAAAQGLTAGQCSLGDSVASGMAAAPRCTRTALESLRSDVTAMLDTGGKRV